MSFWENRRQNQIELLFYLNADKYYEYRLPFHQNYLSYRIQVHASLALPLLKPKNSFRISYQRI